MKFIHRFCQGLAFAVSAVGLSLLLNSAVLSQDKPEPRYKPYPVKKKTEPADADATPGTAQASGTSGSTVVPSNAPSSLSPFGVTPSKSLQARPPTAGKEPMLRLDSQNKPLTEPVHETDRLVYYDCRGTVAPWFAELLAAEMNYFNELVGLPFVDGTACTVSLGTNKSLSPGRLSVQLYNNTRTMNDCVRDDRCPVFRSVSFVPKPDGLYRSYFLSDLTRKLMAQHCVSAKGKWHRDTTCYGIE
jgi:hypothetical protein